MSLLPLKTMTTRTDHKVCLYFSSLDLYKQQVSEHCIYCCCCCCCCLPPSYRSLVADGNRRRLQ